MRKPRQIPLEKLIEGRYYMGRGRNSNVGYWDGNRFWVLCDSTWPNPETYPHGGRHIVQLKIEDYYTKKSGTFKPYRLIEEK